MQLTSGGAVLLSEVNPISHRSDLGRTLCDDKAWPVFGAAGLDSAGMRSCSQGLFLTSNPQQLLRAMRSQTPAWSLHFSRAALGELVLSFFLGSSLALFLAIGVLLALPEKSRTPGLS